MTDDAPQDEPSILSWYDARTPRILDLVGAYAGRELFLVEGDSLLRACFEDERVDFDGSLSPRRLDSAAADNDRWLSVAACRLRGGEVAGWLD